VADPPQADDCQLGILRADGDVPDLQFIAYLIGEQQQAHLPEPSDWLTLGFRVRELGSHWAIDNSWCVATQPWLSLLCTAFANLADHIFAEVEFVYGVMGEEVSGCWRHSTPARAHEAHQAYPPIAVLTAEVIDERGGFVVPPALWTKLRPETRPTVLRSGLLYVPPRPNASLTGA